MRYTLIAKDDTTGVLKVVCIIVVIRKKNKERKKISINNFFD
jgi:hypothetical protein